MSNEEIAGVIRDFLQAMAKRDVEKALSFLTEDAVWDSPNRTSKGKDELRRYFSTEAMRDMRATETGNGIIVQENKAFSELVCSGMIQDQRAELLVMLAYEFSDGKIKKVRLVFDRLSLAQQLIRGWLPKMLVNFIVRKAEKM